MNMNKNRDIDDAKSYYYFSRSAPLILGYLLIPIKFVWFIAHNIFCFGIRMLKQTIAKIVIYNFQSEKTFLV